MAISTMTPTWSLQQAARIAGAAYLITNVTAEFNLFSVRPRLFVAGDVARTASNIAAQAQLYRVAIVMDRSPYLYTRRRCLGVPDLMGDMDGERA